MTDSAASAVALFTGHKVDQDNLGLLPGRANDCSTTREDHIHDGIAELAINKGRLALDGVVASEIFQAYLPAL